MIEPHPDLVPFSFTSKEFDNLNELAELSLLVRISSGSNGTRYGTFCFNEDLLLTHKGLSGPTVLQVSNYWAEVSKKDRQTLKVFITNWSVKPAGTLGWKKQK